MKLVKFAGLLSVVLCLALCLPLIQRVSAAPVYNANAVWIGENGTGWPSMQGHVLRDNLTKVVNDLANNNIQFAITFVGYWNATNPAQPLLVYYDASKGAWVDTFGFQSFFTNVINAFHARGIKAIAWLENYIGTMDTSAANRPNVDAVIKRVMDWGFDGYSDDIEAGTSQQNIDWWNSLTPWLHNGANFADGRARLNMPAVGFDYMQTEHQYIIVDYMVSMFYSSRSTLEDPQAPYYWQENFGEYSGHNTPPASPLILGVMNYYGNTHPLAWQLAEIGRYLSLYGHPQLAGFSFWLYEYMGTRSDDWAQWNYWINRVGTGTSAPPLFTVNIQSTPIPVQLSIDLTMSGSSLPYTPYSFQAFTGTVNIVAPSQANAEQASVLFGDADHTGGAEGYDSYTYSSGPYAVPTGSASVSSAYFYSAVAGNVKLAFYSSRQYSVSGWTAPAWTQYHPDQLLTQSQAVSCPANKWNLITFPAASLPAICFIVIKGDTQGMIGVSGLPVTRISGAYYGYGQFIAASYNTAFPQTFPTVSGAMGQNAAVYVPSGPLGLTAYYFNNWQDGVMSAARAININQNVNLTAVYATTTSTQSQTTQTQTTQQGYGSITVAGIKGGQNVSFSAWIGSSTPVTVPPSGYTFTNVPTGSWAVHANFNGTTWDTTANVANGLTTPVTFNFDVSPTPTIPTVYIIALIIVIGLAAAVLYKRRNKPDR